MFGYLSRMELVLRKMGNSAGVIFPKALLSQLDAQVGARLAFDMKDGQMTVTTVRHPREGWAEAAAIIGALPLTEEEEDWLGFGNEGDDELTW